MGHPDSILFVRILRGGVFQQPQAITLIDSVLALFAGETKCARRRSRRSGRGEQKKVRKSFDLNFACRDGSSLGSCARCNLGGPLIAVYIAVVSTLLGSGIIQTRSVPVDNFLYSNVAEYRDQLRGEMGSRSRVARLRQFPAFFEIFCATARTADAHQVERAGHKCPRPRKPAKKESTQNDYESGEAIFPAATSLKFCRRLSMSR